MNFVNLLEVDKLQQNEKMRVHSPTNEIYLGVFNQNGDMFMSEQDVERAIHFFSNFSQNRLIFEQQQLISRKDNRANAPLLHSFKPKISSRNEKLASRSRSRRSVETTETMVERLRKPLRNPQWEKKENLKI
jgi:hypothetical protein